MLALALESLPVGLLKIVGARGTIVGSSIQASDITKMRILVYRLHQQL